VSSVLKPTIFTIPADTPANVIAEIKAENPTFAFLQVLPPPAVPVGTPPRATAAVPIAATPQALTLWGQLAEGILTAAGSVLKVPAPWLPIVQIVASGGVPLLEKLLSGNPAVETWTADQLKAQMAAVALVVPLT
jgi:hypothetical protein